MGDLRVAIRGDDRRIRILRGVGFDLARGDSDALAKAMNNGKVKLRSKE